MNTSHHQPTVVKLAASPSALSPQLATLLALQRAEEPETSIRLIEVSPTDIFQGLHGGTYDLGIAWMTSTPLTLSVQPLWNDELAVAVPQRSPLLALVTIPVEALRNYPLLCPCPLDYQDMFFQRSSALASEVQFVPMAMSFELMAVLVAAGYGVGIASRLRISQARGAGIVMRPLAERHHQIVTCLFRAEQAGTPAIQRFVERACRVAASENSTTGIPPA